MERELKEVLIQQASNWLGIPIQTDWIQFQPTRKDVVGDLTLMVFPFAKALQRPPAEVAAILGEGLKNEVSYVEGYEVIQGFLNIVFSNESVI